MTNGNLVLQNECCGYLGPLDYINQTSLLDTSCYNKTFVNGKPFFSVFKVNCSGYMQIITRPPKKPLSIAAPLEIIIL